MKSMRKNGPSKSILVNVGVALVLTLFYASAARAQAPRLRKAVKNSELTTARYFESIRKTPPQMLAFLRKMPKGADLHSHLSGAVYAESYVQWAADAGLCVNQTTTALSLPP